jgi:hypothetical protein
VTTKDQLLLRIEATLAKLDVTRKAVEQAGKATRFTDSYGPYFLRRIADEIQRVNDVRTQVQGGATPWASLTGSETLFCECLGFVEAGRARARAIDADLCALADVFLRDIGAAVPDCRWDRFTVLSSDEYFKDFAQIIRLRFPFDGIWELPIAAHEFGHFVAQRLREATPGVTAQIGFVTFKKNYLDTHKDLGKVWEAYLEEIFADVFATYVLGPAFAFACLLLRFDPGASATDGVQHPSYAKRAHAILHTLAMMNNEPDTIGLFKTMIDQLQKSWNESVVSAGQPAEIPDQDRIEYLAVSFYGFLLSAAGDARFTGWQKAKVKQAWLLGNGHPGSGEEPSLVELLNAAWLCRLTPHVSAAQVSARFLELCRPRLKG